MKRSKVWNNTISDGYCLSAVDDARLLAAKAESTAAVRDSWIFLKPVRALYNETMSENASNDNSDKWTTSTTKDN